MKKKLVSSLIMMIFAMIISITAVYALFIEDVSNPISSNFNSGEETDISTVSNEYELRLLAFDRYTNSEKDVSDFQYTAPGNRGQRTSIEFSADISLSYDLTINRDININLASFALNLNGHKLTIKHFYYGTLLIRNGIIQSSGVESNLVYDTPNAIIVEDNLTLTNINKLTLSQNENLLAERIFSEIEEEFDNNYSSDILLKKYYKNTDIAFSWSSNNQNIISNNGIITLPGVSTDVELTLTLSSPDFSTDYTHIYTITVIPATDTRISYGLAELEDFFEYYKYGTDTIYIYSDIELPRENDYYNLSYSYSVVNSSDLENSYTLKKLITSREISLTATIDNNDGTTQDVNYSINVVVENNLDIANNIINELDLYLISNENSVIDLPLFSELEPYGIKQEPNYTFINNNNNYYIEDGQIKVNSLPDSTTDVYIRMGFTFIANDPIYVERDVQIFFVDATGLAGGDSLDRYSYLYYLLNEMVAQKTAGKTFEDFTMPSTYLSYDIIYTLEGVPNGAITIVSDASITLFDIDVSLIPPSDTLIRIKYQFEGSEDIYTKDSIFILEGIINNDENGISDTNLYNAILIDYDEDQNGILTLSEASATKTLFSIDSSVTQTIYGFKGIEFLAGTKKFNFDERNFVENDMNYLSQIDGITHLSLNSCSLGNDSLDMFSQLSSLQILELSYNNITSLDNLEFSNTLVEIKLNDNNINDIDKLGEFSSIEIIYLNNNPIKLFNYLLEMESLQEAYIYNETYPIIDSYYGAEGRNNISTFILLSNNDIFVYNDYDISPILFSSNSDQEKAAEILASIVYYKYSQTEIKVPTRIYETDILYYTITWDYSNLTNATTGITNDIMTISHTSSVGIYEIYASTTISSETIYKVFFIEVN